MVDPSATALNRPGLGILCIVVAMVSISINDMLMKALSGDYALHQMVFVRSVIGISFSLLLVQFEGGFRILRTDRPGLHLLRGLLLVTANMTFFAAFAVLPLAEATALFFVAPLFITLLAIPFLGERVGHRRLIAVAIGFGGVMLMLRPGTEQQAATPERLVMLLPIVAALAYALTQILTRRLGIASKASAMAVYIQLIFIVVSATFWAVAGDGRYAAGVENESLRFLLRAWRWPDEGDIPLFIGLGLNSAIIGYAISQAYRSADAATVAPFEYIALPLAVFWGWTVFGEIPDAWASAGIALIMGAGLYVYLREKLRRRPLASDRRARRW